MGRGWRSDSDRIVKEADQALDILEGDLSSIEDEEETLLPDDTALLDVEFASISLSASELSSLVSGKILNLGEPAVPSVKLYYNGRLAAEGLVMVQDEKIAVKITKKFDSEDSFRHIRSAAEEFAQ